MRDQNGELNKLSLHTSFLFPARKPDQHLSDATCGFIKSEPKCFWWPVSRGYVKYLHVKRFLLGRLVMCQATATSSEILLLIYCPLLSSSPVYRLCKVSKPFIKINSGAGVSFTCRQAEGINPGIRTSSRQWCMFCLLLQFNRSTPHTLHSTGPFSSVF